LLAVLVVENGGLKRNIRAFLAAVIAVVVITAVAALVLDRVQSGADAANTTTGARLDFAKQGTGVH